MDERKRRTKNNKGAISVFLVLILVPCIVVTCLFGDISRVELSKAEASAASDLALYSLMSHYDEELKEYYGLVASCQNIEEFYDVTADYFTGMMSANGISGAGSELFLSYLQALEEGNISDFLQVEFTNAATVTELGNSALGENPALIEDSIVEFMKYRGPYEIVNNILDQLQKKNVLGGVEGAQKDEPIVEARQNYAEAEGEMLEKAFYCYLAIKCYTDVYESKGVPSLGKYQEYEDHLQKIARDFSKVTELITMYYAGTDGIHLVNFPVYGLNAYTGVYQAKNVGEKMETDSETLYCIDSEGLRDMLKDIDKMIQEAGSSADNIAGSCAGLPDPTPANSNVNPALYCMKVQNLVDSSDLSILADRGDKLMRKYAQLKAALDCEPYPDSSEQGEGEEEVQSRNLKQNDLPDDWKNQVQNAIAKIEAVQKEYFAGSGSSPYLSFVQRYRKTAESNTSYPGGLDTIGNVTERRYEFYSEYLGRNTRLGEFLEEIEGEFGQIETDLTEQIQNLDAVIYGTSFQYNGKLYISGVSLDRLKELINTYSARREDWGSAISSSGSDSSYARSERAEYNGGEDADESARLAAAIGKAGGAAVDTLKERLVNIRNDMQEYLDAVKNFKYGGTQVTKLEGREDAIRAGRTVIPDQTDLSLSSNKNAAAGYHRSLLQPGEVQVYQAPEQKSGEKGNIPDLDTDSPELYALFKEQFDTELTTISSEIEANEERNEGYKDEAEEKKGKALEVDGRYLKGKGGSIGSSHGGSAVNALTAIGSIVNIVENLVNGTGDELRDQIYVTEYIMDMFSYSTFNLEGQHRLAAEDGKQYTLDQFSADGYPGYIELWSAEDKTQTPENQSLTNQPINVSHNQMNLGEVEYILYGNPNIDANLRTSYNNIFTIREILNLVSGFQNFYTRGNPTGNVINTIADSVMAATAGVVPSAVTKCVLIGVLATMETAKDMERLKAGVPVALYKSSDDKWYCSIDGDKAAEFKDGSFEIVDEDGIYYGDYLYFFVLLGAANKSTYSAMLLRVGDLIETNMHKMGSDEFDLSKARCYFSLDAELKVKPLLLDLPIVNSLQGVDTSSVINSSGWCTYNLSVVRGYS